MRSATESDYDEVSTVFAEQNSFHVELVPRYIAAVDPPISQEEFDHFVSSPEHALFVAEEHGQIVGTALAELRDADDEPFIVSRRFVFLMDLIVVRAQRRSGSGRALMEAVEAWAAEQGVSDIALTVWQRNERVIAFYESLGYESVRYRMTKSLEDR